MPPTLLPSIPGPSETERNTIRYIHDAIGRKHKKMMQEENGY